MKQMLRELLDALLPKRCALCSAHAASGFCVDCWPLLPWITVGCEVCGTELQTAGLCGACQAHPPYYDHAIIPFRYGMPIAGQIQMLKYHNQLYYANALGAMLSQRVWQDPHALPDVLIPVSLHRKRLRRRGFNQALEIARGVGATLGVRVDYRSLHRIKNTYPQTTLRRAERPRNVQGAFRATPRAEYTPHYKHVALVDDVVTTGSTANAAARALKKSGVETVSIWAVARA